METGIKVITALDGVTATTTSNKIFVGGAKRIGVQLRRADNAGGTSAFAIKASLEPADTTTPTMTALNLWIDNVTNDNTKTLTRVNGTSIANADADKFLFLDPCACISWIEITVTETSDGTHSAFVYLEY
jgi:hypothetical protein